MTTPYVEPPHELHFCSRCKDHAHFEYDPTEGWVSSCCWAPAIPNDAEPPEAA